MRLHTLLVVLVAILSLPARAEPEAATDGLCANPRAATATLLDHLQPNSWQPSLAAACMDVPAERAAEAQRLAIRLKKVLDARGLFVALDEIPTDPAYVDDSGRHRIQPVSGLPEMILQRVDGRWMYDRSTVARIDGLYQATFSPASLAFQAMLPEVFMRRVAGVEIWQGLYLLMLVGLSLAAGRLAQLLLADQILRLARRLGIETTAALLGTTRAPLTWLATSLVFLWGIPDLQLGVRPTLVLMFLARVVLAGALLLAAMRTIDVLAGLFQARAAETSSKVDDQLVPLARRAAKVILAVLTILVMVENMGVDVGGLIAGLGIGGLAVALAAKDTLENFFGSLVIFIDRPFQVGDWVIIDGVSEGIVEEVGFRTTRIRTFQNSVMSVPNGKVANSRVDNLGQRIVRRLKLDLSLTYGTPPDRIEAYVERLRTMLREDPVVWDRTLEVHFNTMGDSSLNVLVYCFLDVPTWSEELAHRQRLLLSFLRLAQELDISFAFPSRSLYLESVPEGWPPAAAAAGPAAGRA
jgi:MscS family membrane protein